LKKIDLLKEQQDNSKIKEKVEGLNNKSDRKQIIFLPQIAQNLPLKMQKTAKLLKKPKVQIKI
jgi:hypothetical protein